MKHMLLIFILAVFGGLAQGQRIHFTDTSNSWNIRLSGGGTEWYSVVHTYKFTGDTMISGNAYKIMTGTSQNRLVAPWLSYPPAPPRLFYREDTLARKLWVRRKSDAVDSLVYDGSWTLGDTIRRRISGNAVEKWYVSGTDSTQMAGQWYKVFRIRSTFNYMGNPDYFAIVEGIGSTAWPNFMYSGAGGGESNFRLLCFNHNNSNPVISPVLKGLYTHDPTYGFTNAGPCDIPWIRLSVPTEAGRSTEAVLYPDPATPNSRIRLPYLVENGVLRIHNMAGQEVSATVISNASVVALPEKVNIPGMYFYRITDLKEGNSFSGRFVFQ